MLWIFLEIEVSVNDTLSFRGKVIEVIPPNRAKIIENNKVIFLNPGRAIVITQREKIPVFVRKFKSIKLPYDSLVLYVNDSFNLNFGNYKYNVLPRNLGYVKNDKLFALEPGIGILVVRSNDAIGRIKIVVKERNKKQIQIPLPNKIVMDRGEKLIFSKYKITSNSNKIKISNDTIFALEYGVANVKFLYEDDTSYGFKNVILIIKPKVLDIIGKPNEKIKIEGKEIQILRERGEVKLENNYLLCSDICFGILKVDSRLVPFLIHPKAYREDDDKDFIIIRSDFEIPKTLEVIRVFPKRKFEVVNNRVIVKERGLGFAVVKTSKGITILKIIGMD